MVRMVKDVVYFFVVIVGKDLKDNYMSFIFFEMFFDYVFVC